MASLAARAKRVGRAAGANSKLVRVLIWTRVLGARSVCIVRTIVIVRGSGGTVCFYTGGGTRETGNHNNGFVFLVTNTNNNNNSYRFRGVSAVKSELFIVAMLLKRNCDR